MHPHHGTTSVYQIISGLSCDFLNMKDLIWRLPPLIYIDKNYLNEDVISLIPLSKISPPKHVKCNRRYDTLESAVYNITILLI